MSSTSVVDKVYLALELTKIRYNGLLNNDTKDMGMDKNILETYLYYIEELTGIALDEIENIPTLKNKLEDLQERYSMLCNTFEVRVSDTIKNNNNQALGYLEECKGDMEHVVYLELKRLLEYKK